jgi:hypothetical protein
MMKYHELVKHHIEDASYENMIELVKETDCFVEEVREHHPEMVDKFLMKVDLALNPDFTKETAKYVVSKMKNKDGTTGEHWNYDTTTKVLEAKGYDFNPCDWYYTLNMVYSDYYKSGRTDDTYVEMAYDFLNDIDGPEHKAKKWAMMC